MYPSTAAIGVALQKLARFPCDRDNKLLIDAQAKLRIAYQLMENRWKIYNSIFWNKSNAATKYTIKAKLEGMTFDVKTLLIDAGRILNQYVDLHHISEDSVFLWCEIVQSLHSANRWIIKDYDLDSNSK